MKLLEELQCYKTGFRIPGKVPVLDLHVEEDVGPSVSASLGSVEHELRALIRVRFSANSAEFKLARKAAIQQLYRILYSEFAIDLDRMQRAWQYDDAEEFYDAYGKLRSLIIGDV